MRFTSNKAKAADALNRGALKGLQDATFDLLNRAVRDAPVDTGDLRGSGSARINDRETARGNSGGASAGGTPPLTNENLEGVVGFTTPYALAQHENMALSHPRGGKAKYLEDAYTQNQAKYEQHIQDAIREAMK